MLVLHRNRKLDDSLIDKFDDDGEEEQSPCWPALPARLLDFVALRLAAKPRRPQNFKLHTFSPLTHNSHTTHHLLQPYLLLTSSKHALIVFSHFLLLQQVPPPPPPLGATAHPSSTSAYPRTV